jgi:membrane protein
VFFIALKISHQHRLLISSLLLVSLTAVHPYAAPESALAFWSDAYVVEFIYGMLLAQLLSSTRFIEHARLPMLAAAAGLALYTWALLPDTGLVTQEMALDKWVRVVVIGLPSTALVVLTLACEQAFRKLGQPAKATIDFLGELSYPIYIFHIYVMGAVKRLGALQFSLPVYTAIVFAATLTVAAAVYVLYEKPVRAFLSRHLLHGKGGNKGKGRHHPPQAAMPLAS